jgi:hypothetical protein
VLRIIEALEADQGEAALECELDSFDPASKEKPGRAVPGPLQGPQRCFGARRGGGDDRAE